MLSIVDDDGSSTLLDRNSGFPAFVRSNAGNFGNFNGAVVPIYEYVRKEQELGW